MPRPSEAFLRLSAVAAERRDGTPLYQIGRWALARERVGLVGTNGSGKSTLLRQLAGDIEPAAGRITRRGRIALVRPTLLRDHRTTVGASLGVGSEGRADADVLRALVTVGLGALAFDRLLDTLSGGELARVAIAAGIAGDPDVLLLDEPTNDLDDVSRAAVHALIRGWRRGLVVASHDRELLGTVDRIISLEGGTLREFGGAWGAFDEARQVARAAADEAHEQALASAARTARHAREVRERKARRDATGRRDRRTGSQPKLVLNAKRERSQATGARLGVALERAQEVAAARVRETAAARIVLAPFAVAMRSSGLRGTTVVLACEAVALGPDPLRPLLDGVDLVIRGPERIAITGANGSGKSTLLRALAGLDVPHRGVIQRGVPLGRTAFLDQHARAVDAGATVAEAFAAHHPRLDREGIHAALARFDFRAAFARTPVALLSSGERMRAALACAMAGTDAPQCLVLDEPNNHLDLEHLEGLESALAAFDGALVVASHDATFLAAVGISRRLDVSCWHAG